MARLVALGLFLVPLASDATQLVSIKKPTGHQQHLKEDQSAPEVLASRQHNASDLPVVEVPYGKIDSFLDVGLEIGRPKLTGGCASSGRNMEAGAATLALAGVWALGLGWLLSKPAPENASAGRLAALDACKFMLMIPVICQHTTFWFGPKVLQGTMQFVHLHTRTFCFVSGMTAQGMPTEKSIKSVVFRLIIPTILWSFAGFAIFDRELLGKRSEQAQLTYLFQAILMAPGISWYMYALVCWRVAGWALLSFKPAARAAASVLIMIMSGYIIDTPGFIRNAGIYLPIFVAGQMFPTKEVMVRIPEVTAPLFAMGISLLVATACWEYSASGLSFLADIPFYSWGNFEGPPDGYCDFTAFSTFWLRGMFRNALEMSKGLVLILFLCPRADSFLSRMGQYSLYTYLLHPWCQQLVNMGIKYYDWRPHPNALSSLSFQWACVFMAMGYACCMNIFLTSFPVRTLFGPILEPVWLERLCGVETKAGAAVPAGKLDMKS